MLGQFRGMLLQAVFIDFFQSPGHLLVEPDSPGGDDLFIKGLAEKGMGKAVADGPAALGSFFDQGRSLGLFYDGIKVFFRYAGHLLEDRQIKLPTYDRGHGQHPVAFLAEERIASCR